MNYVIIKCKCCKKEFESPKTGLDGWEHPDICEECPADPDLYE